MSPYFDAATIARQLDKASRAGKGWNACCPAHDDKNPSLVIYDQPDGVAYKCLAGCSSADIRDALKGLGLWPGEPSRPGGGGGSKQGDTSKGQELPIVWPISESASDPDWARLLGWAPSIIHVYRDAAGRLLFLVARRDRPDGGKDIRPITMRKQRDGTAAWMAKAAPEPRPLYGLDQLADRPEAPVLVVEGEKTADAARGRFPDYVVVTWPGGSSSVAQADWKPLAGRDVILWPDHDDPGRSAMGRVASILASGGC